MGSYSDDGHHYADEKAHIQFGISFYHAFAFLADPVFVFSSSGVLLYSNPASTILLDSFTAYVTWHYKRLSDQQSLKTSFIFSYSGKYYDCVVSADPATKISVIVARDVTHLQDQLVAMQEKVLFYELILNNVPVDMVIFDADHKYVFVNKFAIKDDKMRKWVIGKDDYAYTAKRNMDIKIADRRRQFFMRCIEEGATVEIEDETMGLGNNRKTTLRRFTPIKDAMGKFLFVMGFGIDITDRKNAELSLKHSLEEKEVLLKEVHHRVKNNLTVIYSMLQLAADSTDNAEVSAIFSSSQSRVRSMALVHESLYQSNIFSSLDIVAYTRRLFREISGIYASKKKVEFTTSKGEIFLDIDQGVTIGLILNELIVNFFKYVYGVQETPSLSLTYSTTSEYLEASGRLARCVSLTYHDNGGGFDAEKASTVPGVGLLLLELLSKQVNGKVTKKFDNGFYFHLVWKAAADIKAHNG